MRSLAKRLLVRAGARLPERALYELNGVLNYLETGQWMRRRGLSARVTALTKEGVFSAIAARKRQRQTAYLEFGVAEGWSMRQWLRLLTDPADTFHGFDSFEGLPTRWIATREKGHFATGGVPPAVEDPRVTWHVGWFDETLPAFEMPPREWLIVNLDADLYSSTALVLTWLRDKLQPGDVIYFDEFNHRADELRAFDEFLEVTGRSVNLLASSPDFAHVAFEVKR